MRRPGGAIPPTQTSAPGVGIPTGRRLLTSGSTSLGRSGGTPLQHDRQSADAWPLQPTLGSTLKRRQWLSGGRPAHQAAVRASYRSFDRETRRYGASVSITPRMRRTLAALLLVGLVGTASCRQTVSEGPAAARVEDRIISQILETDDPEVYEVRWFPSGCESLDRIESEIRDTGVWIRVYAFVDSATCVESTGVESSGLVDVGESVGDRLVYDANLKSTVALNQPAQPPEDLLEE